MIGWRMFTLAIEIERLVKTAAEAKGAAARLGYPVVLKGCAHDLLHKTEAGLVAVGLSSAEQLPTPLKH